MDCVGFAYLHGEGVARDQAKAFECFTKAARCGYVVSMTRLGDLYKSGRGTDVDIAKAIEWYEKATALGDKGAMYHLGTCLLLDSKFKDVKKGLTILQTFAAQGMGSAIRSLGQYYNNEQDFASAVKWFKIGASYGDKEFKKELYQAKKLMQQ